MQIIADLQLHSKYSRAVSQKMDLSEIAVWASRKGIQLVATGDWTHPLWFREITSKLQEVTPGIFTLKNRPEEQKNDVYFLLSTEISSIYSQAGKLRRVHNLIFSPSIETCQKIIDGLTKRGANLMADGRPVVGISSKDLLEMSLEIDKNILFIPAHIWTPWFSLFGSKSGFDSIEECFGNLSSHIYAVETGLSSDPLMNWQIKELKNRTILSFSDAHSGPKLGREASVFIPTHSDFSISKLTYNDIASVIKQKDGALKIGYTIEFFPEEGKYHWSGHRVCGIRYNTKEVKEKGTICPKCGKPLTIGVENRVIDLSEKILSENDILTVPNKVGLTFVSDKEKGRRPFVSLIPLQEILLELNGHSQTKALYEYMRITEKITEFDLLLKMPSEEIEKIGGQLLREAVKTVRERKVFVDPGYDGVFGKVQVIKKNEETETETEETQQSLF